MSESIDPPNEPSEPETDEVDVESKYDISNADLVTRERLQAILEYHNRVVEREDQIELEMARGRLPPSKGDELMKASVSSYIKHLQTLIAQRDDGEEWLHHCDLGTFTVEAPNPYKPAWEEEIPPRRIGQDPPENPQDLPDNWRFADDVDLEPVEHQIKGLVNFAAQPSKISEKWLITYDRVYHTEPYTIGVVREREFPREITNRAFRVASHLAEDMGLDVDITDINPETEL